LPGAGVGAVVRAYAGDGRHGGYWRFGAGVSRR
jgi:hypothetical protein